MIICIVSWEENLRSVPRASSWSMGLALTDKIYNYTP